MILMFIMMLMMIMMVMMMVKRGKVTEVGVACVMGVQNVGGVVKHSRRLLDL